MEIDTTHGIIHLIGISLAKVERGTETSETENLFQKMLNVLGR